MVATLTITLGALVFVSGSIIMYMLHLMSSGGDGVSDREAAVPNSASNTVPQRRVPGGQKNRRRAD